MEQLNLRKSQVSEEVVKATRRPFRRSGVEFPEGVDDGMTGGKKPNLDETIWNVFV